ncbi:phage tail sheath subtilisin-like domain-containing protein [Marinomonas atlantica]|uniref:phage tail sheath subtilisin-like domain-containing protein n=1 Tax=Marinomonas atlantica TaxID=1806668 RepID=UPI00083052E8|nr:phage tail sheath subtilisin-like domain-containing protein [Marinomonas atlantica]
MAGTTFLHGVEVIEVDNGSRSIQTVRSAVIGLVGTAPNAAGATAATVTIGSAILNDGLVITAVTAGMEGNACSIELVDPGAPNVAISAVEDGSKITVTLGTDAEGAIRSTANDVDLALDTITLVAATVLGDGTGEVVPLSQTFLAGGADEPFPLGVPVAVAGDQSVVDQLGSSGTLAKAFDDIFDQTGALVIVVRVDEGADSAETQANVILGMDGWLAAKTETGYQPRILIAPEFSQFDGVAAEMSAKAERLRAIAYLDCEMTATYTDAMKRARNYGRRVEISWPWVKVFDTDLAKNVARPLSGRAAGLRARIDADKGFWWSKSNQEIFGIVGTYQPVDWALDDPNTTANMLNENKVSTVINEGGYKYWGNRTCSTDPKWAFEYVRRTADILNDSVQRAHLWAVDASVGKTYVYDVVEGVNAYMRELIALGALIGGRCWADISINSSATLAKGVVYFDFDFCPPGIAEHIIFRSRLEQGYLEEVFA